MLINENVKQQFNGKNSCFSDKLTIDKCKKILQQYGKIYTNEEVEKIRNLLYKLGNLEYQLFTAQKLRENG